MSITTKEKRLLTEMVSGGSVVIHPTDTIYGIGCNALNKKSVERIRAAKKRLKSPFSVIAPSKKWIRDNCELSKEASAFVRQKLPGPYTIIVKLKNKKAVNKAVIPGRDTIGVRLPDHWFTKIIAKAGVPFVTTSVNRRGEPYMTSDKTADPRVVKQADYLVYEGSKRGKPSRVMDFTRNIVTRY